MGDSFRGAHAGRVETVRGDHHAGLLLRGETAHYEAIYNEVARGIGQSQQETGVPHAFGVLTCETLEQALDRAGVKAGNKGFEAAIAAIEMASIAEARDSCSGGEQTLDGHTAKSRASWRCRCCSRAIWASRSRRRCERLFWASRDDVDDETRGFADDLHRVATQREDEIDELIERHAQNWRLERMAAVDRNLLRRRWRRCSAFPKTPAPIVINETLEIARRYAAPESLQFLNGVLDAIGRELLDAEIKFELRGGDHSPVTFCAKSSRNLT